MYRGGAYRYGAAFQEAARKVVGAELAEMLTVNLLTFEDGGLERMEETTRKKLIDRYSAIDQPAAREVVD